MFLLPNYDKELLRRTHNAVVCSYSIQELKRVFNQKFPNQTKELDNFITRLSMLVEFVGVPENIEYDIEKLIRDKNDRPILRAAIFHKVDVIITGDKDFLEAGITNPKAMSAAEFIL